MPTGLNASDVLVFGDQGAAPSYTATNDNAFPSPFTINELLFQANTAAVTISGAPLALGGTNPQIVQNGTVTATINAPVQLAGNLAISGPGTLSFTGPITGNYGITKSGTGTLDFGSASPTVPVDHTFHGGITVNGGSITFSDASNSQTALRSNQVTLAAGASIFGTSEIRLGELSGSGSITGLDTVTGNGQSVALSLLGNGIYSGGISIIPSGGTKSGSFFVRGFGTETLTGSALQINNEITVGRGATLVFSGNASVSSNVNASVVLNGGSFILSNSSTNNQDRLPSATGAGVDGVDNRGGGLFSLVGNTAGTTETVSNLQLGTSKNARSGALTINVTQPVAAASPTVLTFQSYTRDSKDTPRDTVNFTATDASGNTLTLGQSGNNPRILFSTTPGVTNGLLQETGTSLDVNHIGWAIVNGSSFASYDSTNGVIAATTTDVSGALIGAATQNSRLTSDATIGSIDVPYNSLKIQPSTSGSLLLTGTGSLVTNGILLAGNNDYTIANSGGGTGVITGPGGSRYFYVQSAMLTVGVSLVDPGLNSVTKSGAGTLSLTGSNNALLKTLTIDEGTVRATSSGLVGGKIELRGGVLELSGMSTYSATIGAANGNINWGDPSASANVNDRGSGGFSAFGSPVTISLLSANNNQSLSWEDSGFVNSGYALIFGSTRSNARVELTDNLSLTQAPPITGGTNDTNYNLREIRVIDNPSSGADFTRLSGVISGSVRDDLLKTGNGILELTGANTFTGGVVVAEGSLLVNNTNGLGDDAGAYVLLGTRSGTASNAILTSNTNGYIFVNREIDVVAGTTGSAILGNTTGPGAATAGSSEFTGNIVLGTNGTSVARRLQLTAESNTDVTFSGAISTLPGFTGAIDVEKIGAGTVTLAGNNTYTTATTVSAGTLLVTGSISGSTATIKNGATLGGNGITSALNLQAGAVLAPGDVIGDTSILQTGSVAFADSTSKLTIEIGGLNAGGDSIDGYDRLDITGTLTLNNATLQASLINSFAPPQNSLFFIINNDGFDAVSGQFTGLGDGQQFTVGNRTFQISYFGDMGTSSFTGGNDVVLKVVPEPSTGLLLMAAGGVLGTRRRRQG